MWAEFKDGLSVLSYWMAVFWLWLALAKIKWHSSASSSLGFLGGKGGGCDGLFLILCLSAVQSLVAHGIIFDVVVKKVVDILGGTGGGGPLLCLNVDKLLISEAKWGTAEDGSIVWDWSKMETNSFRLMSR